MGGRGGNIQLRMRCAGLLPDTNGGLDLDPIANLIRDTICRPGEGKYLQAWFSMQIACPILEKYICDANAQQCTSASSRW